MKRFVLTIMTTATLAGFAASLFASGAQLRHSKEEAAATAKWNRNQLEQMLDDALQGDAAAMYMTGMCLLNGNGLPPNINHANSFFAASASLGFAPAMDMIRYMYLTEEKNPSLALVYTQLAASLGHPEMESAYQKMKEELIAQKGTAAAEEIERLAMQKRSAIAKTIDRFNKTSDKQKAVLELLSNHGVVGEDESYNSDYWVAFFNPKK